MSPKSWSPVPVIPPLKKRLKKVLAPVALRALPTLSRIAGTTSTNTKPSAAATPPAHKGFVRGYRALEQEFPEADSPGNGKESTPPTKVAVQLKVDAARKAKSSALNLDQIARGSSLVEPVLVGVRHLVSNGERNKAVAVGHSLRKNPATHDMSAAVLGVGLLASSGPINAWAVFSEIANTSLSEPVADELYAAAFGALGARAAPLLDADIESGRIQRWGAAALLHVAQKALARGLTDQARILIGVAQQVPEEASSKPISRELARLATWLPEGTQRAEIPHSKEAINYGIVGYQQPDITSRNIGDYIQTVASMGHIVRQSNFSFTGDPEIVRFAEELRASTKPERVVDGPTATLNLLELNRDGNPYQALPEKTWALTFGWLMHDTFQQGFGIPFHKNLRPILLSVYVRFPAMLTPDAIDYLRKYAPVGCRDWQTVALLRAVGVPAFFSGCMTTTIDTVFRREGEDTRDATIFVDSPQTGPGKSRTQVQTGIRSLSFVENLRLAREWVSHYHLEYSTVVTSRLHCFLPSRSVGSSVTFLPKNRSDNRFGGLIDTTDEAFEKIRQGILDKASTMLQTIATGASENDVYSKWAEICAPAMAEADEYLASAKTRVLDLAEVARIVSTFATTTSAANDADANTLNVVIDVRRGELKHVPTLVRSIAAHNTGTVQIWIAYLNPSATERKDLLDQDLPLPINWISPVASSFESLGSGFKYATKHELMLALVSEALPKAQQAVFVPAAALLRSDISALAQQRPATNNLVTASHDRNHGRQSGLALIRRVSSRQGEDNRKALELVFATHREHSSDFVAFDPNVMVMNLDLAQRENLSGRLIPLILDYGMSYREAINVAVGSNRTELDIAWNHAPGYEVQEDPALVNWRDTSKPWNALATPFADEWKAS
ncbi:hypothetical protein [Paeniglutamicibacter terrestris]|uniref:Uncharacterized protein n=1 Tax=Paeniglutamicibacter terrestris TaxID=2723403 RepID=A0ABX1G7Q6_9MICC|nr:hypothetical protein [Paeniglutamicibacter terrestris]NKG22296.1 hypothetical protein [Paeniglutamicibacter terrestris]